MAGRIRVRKHEAIPDCGSFEVQVPGKGSTFFYWDDIAGRRLRPEMTREQALAQAKALARAERGEGRLSYGPSPGNFCSSRYGAI
jgi:hypothetical protein